MTKTGNTPFKFQQLDIKIDSDIFMPMQSLNELRRGALDALEEHIVSKYYRADLSDVTDNDRQSACKINNRSNTMSNKSFAVSVETKEQLKHFLKLFFCFH